MPNDFETAKARSGSVQPDCSARALDLENYALLRKFELLQHRHRGGGYRKHPVDGPIEQAATEAIRLLRHVEAQISQIEKAQNDQTERPEAK